MSQINRSKPVLYQRNKLIVRTKYIVGTGIVTSLAMAFIFQYVSQRAPVENLARAVPIISLEKQVLPQEALQVYAPIGKELRNIESFLTALESDKSAQAQEKKTQLRAEWKRLKEIEDHQLRLSQHAGEPGFDTQALQDRIQVLESLRTSHHQ